MAYKVIVGVAAEKEFAALSQGERKAIFQKLRLLETEPKPKESIELAGYPGLRRIKAGNVRAIYEEPDIKYRIFVRRFGVDHSIYSDLDGLTT